jgi:hypothetical protein
LVPTVVSLLLAESLALASPAHAYGVPTSTIDLSTPGHASITVTSDAPYVAVRLESVGEHVGDEVLDLPFGDWTVEQVTDGYAAFDLATWGVDTGRVLARTCSGATLDSCGAAAQGSATFAPGDVDPVATWPEDDTVGNGQSYAVTVADTGGGDLVAVWDVGQYFGPERTPLTRDQATTLSLADDGSAPVVIQRCSAVDWRVCHDTVAQHAITVNKHLSAYVVDAWLGEISPAVGTKLNPVIATSEGQNFTLGWSIENLYGNQVAGFSGVISGLEPDAQGEVHPVIDPTGLPDSRNNYTLRMELSYDDPKVGEVKTGFALVDFRIDTVGTPITKVSATPGQLYPYRDSYRDSVAITVARPWDYVKLRLEILNADNSLVKAFVVPSTVSDETFVWTGRNSAGQVVPGGTYHFRATLTDAAGNVTTKTQGSVSVVRKKVVSRTFTHTYSAAGSLLQKVVVGSCSRLASPSSRGWSGSLGFYSNKKCSKSFEASIIETRHAVRVPAALKYGSLRVSMYGGAAREAPRSISYITYIKPKREFTKPAVMRPGLGNHAGPSVNGAAFVFSDRSIGWDVFNAKGSRYDVKSFTVKLGYTVLVAD